MAALSILGAQWRLKSNERAFLLAELLPWAVQAGTRCADLMCLDYEQHFKVIQAPSSGWRRLLNRSCSAEANRMAVLQMLSMYANPDTCPRPKKANQTEFF